jgi:ABC-type transporter Mla subunit MlaD
MSGADDILDQAKDLIGDHADDVKKGIKEAADFVDDTTDKKHGDTIDQVESAAKGLVNDLDDSRKPAKKKASKKTS